MELVNISGLDIFLLSLIAILSIFSIYTFYKLNKISSTFRTLSKGTKDKNLEELLENNIQQMNLNNKKIQEIEHEFKSFVKASKRNFRKMSFLRYNPFHETGGNQSFILALLDENNNGFLLSSLHQRDLTRVYSKSINQGKCDNKLSKEELSVLNDAINKK